MRISIDQACKLLLNGEIVGIPTDTVYGIAASLHQRSAIEAIFTLKGRPSDKPLIIQVATYAEVLPFLPTVPPDFEKLASTFWPGPLTLVVPVNTLLIPEIVRAGLPTAGFRIPNHHITLELLKKTGPLVVPSANPTDHPPATNPQHIESYFGQDFPVIDGDACLHGQPSTILEFKNNKWNLLREGVISKDQLSL